MCESYEWWNYVMALQLHRTLLCWRNLCYFSLREIIDTLIVMVHRVSAWVLQSLTGFSSLYYYLGWDEEYSCLTVIELISSMLCIIGIVMRWIFFMLCSVSWLFIVVISVLKLRSISLCDCMLLLWKQGNICAVLIWEGIDIFLIEEWWFK